MLAAAQAAMRQANRADVSARGFSQLQMPLMRFCALHNELFRNSAAQAGKGHDFMKKLFSARFDTALTQVLNGELRRAETLAGFNDELYKISIYRCSDDLIRVDFKKMKPTQKQLDKN